MLISGEAVPAESGAVLEVRNPARPDEVVGTVPRGAAEDVDRAVAAAASAFPAWAATPVEKRAGALLLAADRLAARTPELAPLLTREMGKVVWESGFDVAFGEYVLRFCAGMAAEAVRPEEMADEHGWIRIEKAPMGVVGAIVPWNWPVGLLFIKIGHALATGNTLVAVPSPYAPLAVTQAVAAIAEVLPPGVVNTVTGTGPEVGQALTRHPKVRKIAFTGGVETGREVLRSLADTIKVPTLELGGNDPAILLDDVEVTEELAQSLVTGALTTSGQICFAIKRVYAARNIYEPLVEAVTAAASASVVGDGLVPGTTMGPLVNDRQLKRFRGFVDDARQRGGQVTEVGALGDSVRAEGYFHLPVIVTGVDDDAAVVREEQFGPAIPILAFDTTEEAIARANDSEFGLKSSVWSSDPERADAVARRLEAGTTFINQHSVFAVDMRGPIGGFKQSGLGREMGSRGFEDYVELHQINNRHAPPPPV